MTTQSTTLLARLHHTRGPSLPALLALVLLALSLPAESSAERRLGRSAGLDRNIVSTGQDAISPSDVAQSSSHGLLPARQLTRAADFDPTRLSPALQRLQRPVAAGETVSLVARAPQLSFELESQGLRVTPLGEGESAWEWGVQLESFGREGDMRAAGAVGRTRVANRLLYDRELMTEWFVQRPAGIEHGFTIPERIGNTSDGDFVVELSTVGALRGSVSEDGKAVTLLDATGAEVLEYAKLLVLDANNVELTASLQLTDAGLSIRVDDAAATYPVVIDPRVGVPPIRTIHDADFKTRGVSHRWPGAAVEEDWSFSLIDTEWDESGSAGFTHDLGLDTIELPFGVTVDPATEFGVSVSAASNGHAKLDLNLLLEGGSLDVDWPYRADLKTPGVDSFAPDDIITIDTNGYRRDGAKLEFSAPRVKIALDTDLAFTGLADARACFGTCTDDLGMPAGENEAGEAVPLEFTLEEEIFSWDTDEYKARVGGELLTTPAGDFISNEIDPVTCELFGFCGTFGVDYPEAGNLMIGDVLHASTQDRVMDVTLDLWQIAEWFKAPPLSIGIPEFDLDGDGETDLSAEMTLASIEGVYQWDWRHQWAFQVDEVRVRFPFPFDVHWQERAPDGTPVRTATSSTPHVKLGNKLLLQVPGGLPEAIGVYPEFYISKNKLTHTGTATSHFGIDVKVIEGNLTLPETTIIEPGAPICYGTHILTGDCPGPLAIPIPCDDPLKACEERFGGLVVPEVAATLGPLKHESLPLATEVDDIMLDNNIPPWQLEGFRTIVGEQLVFDPAFPPVAVMTAPDSGDEGASLSFDASRSYDQDGDELSFAWSFGDGSTSTAVDPQHVFTDNGDYTVTLIVTDACGDMDTATKVVSIRNVAPTVSVSAAQPSVQYSDLALVTVTFTDPGSADTFTSRIEWGADRAGCSRTSTFATADISTTVVHRGEVKGNFGKTHQFLMPAGTHTLTAHVSDDDGGTTAAGTTIAVEREDVAFSVDATRAPYSDAVTLTARLFDNDVASGQPASHDFDGNVCGAAQNAGLEGAVVDFFFDTGATLVRLGSALSDANGAVSLVFEDGEDQLPDGIDLVAGAYAIEASFEQDQYYASASGSASYEVLQELPVISFDGFNAANFSVVNDHDETCVTISAVDDDAEVLYHQDDEPKLFSLYVDDGGFLEVASGVLVGGTADFRFATGPGTAWDPADGIYDLRVEFEGDARYLPAQVDRSAGLKVDKTPAVIDIGSPRHEVYLSTEVIPIELDIHDPLVEGATDGIRRIEVTITDGPDVLTWFDSSYADGFYPGQALLGQDRAFPPEIIADIQSCDLRVGRHTLTVTVHDGTEEGGCGDTSGEGNVSSASVDFYIQPQGGVVDYGPTHDWDEALVLPGDTLTAGLTLGAIEARSFFNTETMATVGQSFGYFSVESTEPTLDGLDSFSVVYSGLSGTTIRALYAELDDGRLGDERAVLKTWTDVQTGDVLTLDVAADGLGGLALPREILFASHDPEMAAFSACELDPTRVVFNDESMAFAGGGLDGVPMIPGSQLLKRRSVALRDPASALRPTSAYLRSNTQVHAPELMLVREESGHATLCGIAEPAPASLQVEVSGASWYDGAYPGEELLLVEGAVWPGGDIPEGSRVVSIGPVKLPEAARGPASPKTPACPAAATSPMSVATSEFFETVTVSFDGAPALTMQACHATDYMQVEFPQPEAFDSVDFAAALTLETDFEFEAMNGATVTVVTPAGARCPAAPASAATARSASILVAGLPATGRLTVEAVARDEPDFFPPFTILDAAWPFGVEREQRSFVIEGQEEVLGIEVRPEGLVLSVWESRLTHELRIRIDGVERATIRPALAPGVGGVLTDDTGACLGYFHARRGTSAACYEP